MDQPQADRPLPIVTRPDLDVVLVSSVFTDTPEGMSRMDRLQAQAEEEREELYALLSESGRQMVEDFDRELERRILFGDAA